MSALWRPGAHQLKYQSAKNKYGSDGDDASGASQKIDNDAAAAAAPAPVHSTSYFSDFCTSFPVAYFRGGHKNKEEVA